MEYIHGLPALVPQVGSTGGVVLTAKLVGFGIYLFVVNSHACCQHADGTYLYYLHAGSDICLFQCLCFILILLYNHLTVHNEYTLLCVLYATASQVVNYCIVLN